MNSTVTILPLWHASSMPGRPPCPAYVDRSKHETSSAITTLSLCLLGLSRALASILLRSDDPSESSNQPLSCAVDRWAVSICVNV